MIQFTASGVEITASPAKLSEARDEFERRRLIHLPRLLSPEVADMVRQGMERDGF
jgi:hypothetical protein